MTDDYRHLPPTKYRRLRLPDRYADPALEDRRQRVERLRAHFDATIAAGDAARRALREAADADRAAAARALRDDSETPKPKAPSLRAKVAAAEEAEAVAALALEGELADLVRHAREHHDDLVAEARRSENDAREHLRQLIAQALAAAAALADAEATTTHLDRLRDGRSYTRPRKPTPVDLGAHQLQWSEVAAYLTAWADGPKPADVLEFSAGIGTLRNAFE